MEKISNKSNKTFFWIQFKSKHFTGTIHLQNSQFTFLVSIIIIPIIIILIISLLIMEPSDRAKVITESFRIIINYITYR